MIEARNLSKRYGTATAVDDLSLRVLPGRVTGFLGPNGAGKTTTMRLLLGLARPDSGEASIDGKQYRDLAQPLRTVGALLEGSAVHGGRSARAHLRWLAKTQSLPRQRVDEVTALVGLSRVAGKRAGGFSLGMGQRLGIAAALLGDPKVLMLDEPLNGLDPEGIVWVRNLMRDLAVQGRTVFVSSHLMNEMAVTADHLIVIGGGRPLADCGTTEFVERHSHSQVLARTADAARLRELVTGAGGHVRAGDGDTLTVTGMPAQRIAELATWARIVVYELTPQRGSLEQAFMELTAGSLQYHGGHTPPGQPHPPGPRRAQAPAAESGRRMA